MYVCTIYCYSDVYTHTHTHTHSDATAKLNCPYNIMCTVHTYAGTLLQYTDTYLTASYTVYITTYYTILTACTLTYCTP